MQPPAAQYSLNKDFILKLIAFGVGANGFIIMVNALVGELIFRNTAIINPFAINVPVLIGLSLIYLATLLARRKRAAWMIVVPLYGFVFGINVTEAIMFASNHHLNLLSILRNIILPGIVVASLLYYRNDFIVKSDIRSFRYSLRTIALIFMITLFYGVAGFLLMDDHDFHQDITVTSAFHHTIDQFDFTTDKVITPYTRRAHLFVDSLNLISIGAVIYAGITLFQPLRARFSDQTNNRERIKALMHDFPAGSEDFFKLWPQDKQYFFSPKGGAALAYHVQRGVALVVGDPVGNPKSFNALLRHFMELCRVNDWVLSFIHTDPKRMELYKRFDFALQKIGEEAILDLAHFHANARGNKYFRQIRNKFEKQEYSSELLQPPHNAAVLARLKEISKNWLDLPGRSERGFMMGYYSDEYMQQCPILVIRDGASTIQAFINQIPSFDAEEANYDLLRHTVGSLGNINDFLLMRFIDQLYEQGYKRLNLGLCPLVGLENQDQDKTVIDSALQFMYANGDRLYSFSGLHRFKAKYEPQWSSRYIAYPGGIRSFTRAISALNAAMNHTKSKK